MYSLLQNFPFVFLFLSAPLFLTVLSYPFFTVHLLLDYSIENLHLHLLFLDIYLPLLLSLLLHLLVYYYLLLHSDK